MTETTPNNQFVSASMAKAGAGRRMRSIQYIDDAPDGEVLVNYQGVVEPVVEPQTYVEPIANKLCHTTTIGTGDSFRPQ